MSRQNIFVQAVEALAELRAFARPHEHHESTCHLRMQQLPSAIDYPKCRSLLCNAQIFRRLSAKTYALTETATPLDMPGYIKPFQGGSIASLARTLESL